MLCSYKIQPVVSYMLVSLVVPLGKLAFILGYSNEDSLIASAAIKRTADSGGSQVGNIGCRM